MAKRALIISDSSLLSRAVTVQLRHYRPELDIVQHAPAPSVQNPEHSTPLSPDLIVAALSSPRSELIVILAQAGLIQKVGRVPLLVISTQPFTSDRDLGIIHLNFPFESADLCTKIDEMVGPGEHSRQQKSRESVGVTAQAVGPSPGV